MTDASLLSGASHGLVSCDDAEPHRGGFLGQLQQVKA